MLTIPLSTVGWIILKARELEVNDSETIDASSDIENPLGMQEDRIDDSSLGELTSWISDLNIPQCILPVTSLRKIRLKERRERPNCCFPKANT